MIRVLTVFGTRPEAIKFAPVIRALEADGERFASTVCVTAQHREMLDQVLANFGLTADLDLDLMKQAQSPADVVSQVLKTMPGVIEASRPDIVLVQGDTATTFAAAFGAYLARVPVGHVEAGLRTGNLDHPFPEEMNRILTTRVASMHFAPTRSARQALLDEGVEESSILVTGNTVVDALLASVRMDHQYVEPSLQAIEDAPVVLVTTHRRESFGEPLENICKSIKTLAARYTEYRFVLPVHPNPNVQAPVRQWLSELPNVILCNPLEYLDFVNLMARSRLILTDSGGVQEEAPSMGVPVLVMRETTERPEGVEAGCARLVGTNANKIIDSTCQLLDNDDEYRRMAGVDNPYGDGTAARQIVDAIANRIGARIAA